MDHPSPSDLAGRTDSPVQWTACPARRAVAEIRHRRVLPSTAGPVEHVGVLCVARHTFLVPVDALDPVPPTGSR
jgi:hypothetical protein